MLLTARKSSYGDLTRPLLAGSGALITGELQTAFSQYGQSLRLPGEDGAAFFGSAEKLAAMKMARDNVSASDAADWAYNELIGKRYAFEGSARLPREQADLAYALEDAKRTALQAADLSALPPGVSPEDARSWLETSTQ
jgi:hypothetical protein